MASSCCAVQLDHMTPSCFIMRPARGMEGGAKIMNSEQQEGAHAGPDTRREQLATKWPMRTEGRGLSFQRKPAIVGRKAEEVAQ